MRTVFRSMLATVVAASVAAPLTAQQNARASLVVDAHWVAQHLRDPNLVLLHVSDRADYDKGHIPGARFVDFHDMAVMQDPGTKLTMQLPPDDTLRAHLAGLGVSDNSRIVVYFSSEWVSPATRVIMTLDYAGLGGATSLMDGGAEAFVKAGHALTADATPARTGTVSKLRTKPVMVSADFVRDHLGKPGYALVDARASAFYDGVSEGGPQDARRKGHIAGALSVPFTEVTTDNGDLKSADDLAALFRNAGVKPDDTIIGYCHVGQQATAMLFAARTLGYRVLLFDGSFEEWARRGWPVEISKGK